MEKLVPYKQDGFNAVLLIEGILTRNKILYVITLAFPDDVHPDLDEIWMSLLGETILVNSPNWRNGVVTKMMIN
jgi:hypothetical protein